MLKSILFKSISAKRSRARLERSRSIFEDDDDVGTGSIHLRILSTSDVYELNNWGRFYTALQELRLPEEEGNYNVVIIPGDFLAPSVISCIDHGASMVDCLNEVGFEYCCFGNHETDVPMKSLANRIRESKFKWINSNMKGLPSFVPESPEYCVINMKSSTQTRSVALLGLITDDKFLYKPGAFGGAKIKPVAETALRLHEELKSVVDCIVPMTHQSMAHDRHLAMICGKRFPVIIGGHDHSPFTETLSGVTIIKAGMDAINLAVTDLIWPSPKTVGSSPDVFIQMIPVKRFEENERIRDLAKAHQVRVLSSLEQAHIVGLVKRGVRLGSPVSLSVQHISLKLTSKNIRTEQTSMGKLISSILRDALLGDCCLVPSGSIRRGIDYDDDYCMFTYRDLVAELPFEDDVVVVEFPGHVIEEGIKFSHGPLRKGMGGYIQLDSGIEYIEKEQTVDEHSLLSSNSAETHALTFEIKSISGAPFDRDRIYRMVINIQALEGIDENVPLIRYFNESKVYRGIGPLEGDVHRQSLKTAFLTVIGRRRLVSIWHDRKANGLMDRVHFTEGMSKSEFSRELINLDSPDWLMEQIFTGVDFDGDGFIGLTDIAVAYMFCWFAGPITGIELDPTYRIDVTGTTTVDELRGHLEAVLPRDMARSVIQEVAREDSPFVTRSDVFKWLEKVRANNMTNSGPNSGNNSATNSMVG